MVWDGREARKSRQRAKDVTPVIATLRSAYSHWRLPGIARVLRPGVALPEDQKEVDDYSLLINDSQRDAVVVVSHSSLTCPGMDREVKLDGVQGEEELRLTGLK